MKVVSKINKWVKVSAITILLGIWVYAIAQDVPTGYTTNYGFRMWDEGNHPSADSVNQNLIDIDQSIYKRDQRIDSLAAANSAVFPKLASANTFTGLNMFNSGKVMFDNSPNGTVLDFVWSDGSGGIFISHNDTVSLLKYDDADGDYWQVGAGMTVDGDVDITGLFKINGTPISAGGGDAYLGNRQTFTKRQQFNDTVAINSGKVIFDNSPSGTVLDFVWQDGSGGIFITHNDTVSMLKYDDTDGDYWQFGAGMTVDGDVDVTGTFKINGTPISGGGGDAYLGNRQTFTKRQQFNDTIAGTYYASFNKARMDSLLMTGNIYPADGKGLFWANPSSISSIVGVLTYKSSTHEFFTEYGSPLVTFDTLGVSLASGIPFGADIVNGATISSTTQSTNDLYAVNVYGLGGNLNFDGIFSNDSAMFKLPTKIKNEQLIFENTNGAKKAILSTNADGDLLISTNRAVAIMGDLEVSGFTVSGELSRREKTVVKSRILGDTTAKAYSVAHGIPNCCDNVTSFTFSVKRDTSANTLGVPQVLYGGYNGSVPFSTGTFAYIDTLVFTYYLISTSYALMGDSVIFRATYTP